MIELVIIYIIASWPKDTVCIERILLMDFVYYPSSINLDFISVNTLMWTPYSIPIASRFPYVVSLLEFPRKICHVYFFVVCMSRFEKVNKKKLWLTRSYVSEKPGIAVFTIYVYRKRTFKQKSRTCHWNQLRLNGCLTFIPYWVFISLSFPFLETFLWPIIIR